MALQIVHLWTFKCQVIIHIVAPACISHISQSFSTPAHVQLSCAAFDMSGLRQTLTHI